MPLVVSAVHNFLVEQKLRSKVSLIIISGDAIEDHHFAVLAALEQAQYTRLELIH